MATRHSPSSTLSTLSSNPRADLTSWLRVKDTIELAFNSFPQPYLFIPTSLSLNTFITLARDAIRGAIAFDYPSFTSREDLQSWYSKVIFTQQSGKVYIGPKTKPELTTVTGTDSAYLSSSPFQFASLLPEETYAFALLLSHGKIQGPVEIHLPPPDLSFSSFTNLEHSYKSNGTLVLL